MFHSLFSRTFMTQIAYLIASSQGTSNDLLGEPYLPSNSGWNKTNTCRFPGNSTSLASVGNSSEWHYFRLLNTLITCS